MAPFMSPNSGEIWELFVQEVDVVRGQTRESVRWVSAFFDGRVCQTRSPPPGDHEVPALPRQRSLEFSNWFLS